MRTSIKKLKKAVAGKDLEQIKKVLQETVSVIDKTSKKGAIHSKTGDRYKARVFKLVNSKGA
jgi:ribosomal protein S20